jgi:hypothetical protein
MYDPSSVKIDEPESGYCFQITPEGFTELVWKLPCSNTLSYVKAGFLQKPVNSTSNNNLLHYFERIKIKAKPDFGLWLGSPYGELSAVRARSTAIFEEKYSGKQTVFKPRELAEHVFHKIGTLTVNWILEVI